MAQATPDYNLVVKGDPKAGALGDCPFCHRALLTMEVKGLPFTRTYVDFKDKPEWLTAAGGKVPILRGPNDLFMPDSDEITEYLEKQHPEPSMASTVDPAVGAKLFPAFRQFLFSAGGSPDEASKREALTAELKALNQALNGYAGPLFGGDTLNATDAAIAPKLYHIQVALAHFKGYQIPEELRAVHRYLTAIKQLPAWKATDYGAAKIIQGWEGHLAEAH